MKKQRVLAWIGIIALAALYVSDLVLAIIGSPFTRQMLKICLFMTIVIPVVIWIFLMLMRKTSWQKRQVYGAEDYDSEAEIIKSKRYSSKYGDDSGTDSGCSNADLLEEPNDAIQDASSGENPSKDRSASTHDMGSDDIRGQ